MGFIAHAGHATPLDVFHGWKPKIWKEEHSELGDHHFFSGEPAVD